MSGKDFQGGTFAVSVRLLCVVSLATFVVGALVTMLTGVNLFGSRVVQRTDAADRMQPKAAKAEPLPAPPATYVAVIRPLFDSKCSACHGESKQKGGMSLATQATIEKGGRHGTVIDRTDPEKSLMLARITLALDEEKHMPPDDHDQLASEELAALEGWIRAGAPFEGVVQGIDALPSARIESAAPKPASAVATPPADPAALATLRSELVHVQPVSEGSALLWIDFAAAAKSFDDAKVLPLVAPLHEQICDLSLARSQVGDGTISALAKCPNLHKLDVRSTAVTDSGVAALASHVKLAELVLSQNKLTDACVDSLIAMPALDRVHLWRSGMSAEGIARLREARPKLHVDDGAEAASVALEAETTIALTKAPPAQAPPVSSTAAPSLVPVNTKCPVTGAPVNLKFTIVHEGRVIGFCCPNCPKEFWADPAKFSDRLQ